MIPVRVSVADVNMFFRIWMEVVAERFKVPLADFDSIEFYRDTHSKKCVSMRGFHSSGDQGFNVVVTFSLNMAITENGPEEQWTYLAECEVSSISTLTVQTILRLNSKYGNVEEFAQVVRHKD